MTDGDRMDMLESLRPSFGYNTSEKTWRASFYDGAGNVQWYIAGHSHGVWLGRVGQDVAT
jgi:hypothetical protein